MNKKGFVLLELIIVIAIIAALAGGGLYLTQLQNEHSAVTAGVNAEQQAQQVIQQSDQQTQQEQNILDQTAKNTTTTPNPKPTTTTPIPPPPPSGTGTTRTINGVAYLSPNQGEGLSVQYNEPVEESDPNNPGKQITVMYHPFQDLQYHIDANTKITNSENQAIPFSDIKVGDNLLVQMSAGPCVMGVPGGSSGCNIKIFSIQDLSL
jgi:prepilin-type N-terminal cleavage/methylation domain-containing protein